KNRSPAGVKKCERVAALKQCESGSRPSLNQFAKRSLSLKRQFVLIGHDEAVRPAVGRLSVLLPHVRRVVEIRGVKTDVRKVLAPRISHLESVAMRKILAHCGLQAVVLVNAVEPILLETICQEAQKRVQRRLQVRQLANHSAQEFFAWPRFPGG